MNYDSPKFLLDDVLKATTGNLVTGALEKTFYGISTDSRLVKKGNLFIALKGEKFDGHDFVNQALQQGAAGIIVHDAKVSKDLTDKNVTVIKVADTLIALGDLAHEWRKRFSITVIGLTGSSGKTTTKEMIAAIIGRKKNILKTEGNLNNLIGLPQTIFRLTTEHELAILEMGTNTRGEIKRLTQIALPDIGLITNIGPAHLAGFGSIDVVSEEKGDLFLNMSPSRTIIVNIDDKAVAICAERWIGRKITFSMSPNADVTVKDIKMNGIKGMSFNLVVGENTQKVEMKIVGLHHVNNAMAAAAAAFTVGTDIKTIAEGLAEFRPFS